MIVFKCFLKMIKKNVGMMVLYFVIFFTVCLLMQFATDGKAWRILRRRDWTSVS